MTDPYPAILDLLTEMEKRPRSANMYLFYPKGKGCVLVLYGKEVSCWKDDAHNAIFRAALEVLREWCSKKKRGLIIEELDGTTRIGYTNGFDDALIASGPTIEAALLEALQQIKETP